MCIRVTAENVVFVFSCFYPLKSFKVNKNPSLQKVQVDPVFLKRVSETLLFPFEYQWVISIIL